MAAITNCPNCNEKIREGVFGINLLLHARDIQLINRYREQHRDAYCNKCGDYHLNDAIARLKVEYKEIQDDLQKQIGAIPLATIHSPAGWDYQVISMVTAQTTTGTGFLSEITSSWTDMLGSQNKTYNNKLRNGEELCKGMLRQQALAMGANAIVGVDIDYSEIGGEKAMLMVCMSGTAVSLNNIEVMGPRFADDLGAIQACNARLADLDQFNLN